LARTCLITGGGGNLARQLASQLIAEGDDVVLFDIVEQPESTRIEHCEYMHGDLTRPEDIEIAFKRYKPELLLHLASVLSGKCEEDHSLAWQVNVVAAFSLLEAAMRHGVKSCFFPSSIAGYGGDLPEQLGEDHAQWPEGLYGVTKVTCERLGNYYHKVHGLDFRCLRLPIVISRFAPPGAASAYASRAFIEAIESRRFTFKVNPTTLAPIVYVRDVLAGIRQLIRAPAERLTRCVYNIHAMAPTAQEIADAVALRVPEAKIDFQPDPDVVSLIEGWPHVFYDASARKDWDWSPEYDLDRLADDYVEELRREFGNAQGI